MNDLQTAIVNEIKAEGGRLYVPTIRARMHQDRGLPCSIPDFHAALNILQSEGTITIRPIEGVGRVASLANPEGRETMLAIAGEGIID